MPKLLVIVVSVFLLVEFAAAAPVNDWCPVTPDEPAESHLTVEFEGQTIGFCCRACVRKFLADPEIYRANLPMLAPAAPVDSASNLDPTTEVAKSTQISFLGRIGRLLGNLHILAIHFPIALLLLATPLEAVAIFRRSEKFAFAARVNFLIGSVTALAAATLGWISAANSHYTGDAAAILEWHRWLGTSLAIVAIAGVGGLLLERTGDKRGTTLFRVTVIILLILVPIASHFGGSLVYGPDHLSI